MPRGENHSPCSYSGLFPFLGQVPAYHEYRGRGSTGQDARRLRVRHKATPGLLPADKLLARGDKALLLACPCWSGLSAPKSQTLLSASPGVERSPGSIRYLPAWEPPGSWCSSPLECAFPWVNLASGPVAGTRQEKACPPGRAAGEAPRASLSNLLQGKAQPGLFQAAPDSRGGQNRPEMLQGRFFYPRSASSF